MVAKPLLIMRVALSVATRNVLERVGRVELRIIGLEGRWTPLVLSTRLLVAEEGIEPPTPAYETGKIPFLYSAIVSSAYDYAESVLMLSDLRCRGPAIQADHTEHRV